MLCSFVCFLSYAPARGTLNDFDVNNAREHIIRLDRDLSTITEELKALDTKEVDKYGALNTRYKEVRWEIVKVIQNINHTVEVISKTLKDIDSYKAQVILSLKELKAIEQGITETK